MSLLYVTLTSSIVEECYIAHILKKRELRSLGIRENSVECLQKLLMPFPILNMTVQTIFRLPFLQHTLLRLALGPLLTMSFTTVDRLGSSE